MRILCLSWRDPKHPKNGGAEQVMHEHMKGWVKSGNSVTLFSSKFNNSKESEIIDGIKIIRKGGQYLGVQLQAFLYFLKNRKNIDFVVDQFHGIPFFTPIYVRKPKVAVIQETATKVWFLNPFRFPFNYLTGAIGYISEPLIFLLYKKTEFITGSLSAKKSLINMGINETKIKIINHGVNVSKKYSNDKKEKIITFLGMISKDKGIEDAIDAFKIISESLVDYKFYIIGKAETPLYLDLIKQKVKDLNITSKVKFWGFVSNNFKFKLLAKSKILVNPSLHEGWGLVNIEANYYKTPVVSYNSEGLCDSVIDNYNGIIVKANTPSELAKEVINLSNNGKKYDKLSENSFKWAKNFSWEKMTKDSNAHIKKIYEKFFN